MTKTQIAILWGLAAVVLIVFIALSWFIARPAQGDMPMVGPSVQAYRLPAVSFSARGFSLTEYRFIAVSIPQYGV